jgi:hypothetical protein
VNNNDLHSPYSISIGPTSLSELVEILENEYVANEKVTNNIKGGTNVFVSSNRLVVNTANANETISVYSLVGSLVDKFQKTEQNLSRDASSYPSGILIVSSSSGWTKKIINRK